MLIGIDLGTTNSAGASFSIQPIPSTTLENLQALKPVVEGGVITAGNASQAAHIGQGNYS